MAIDFLTPITQGLAIRDRLDRTSALREQQERQKQIDFLSLNKERQGALFQDARLVNSFLKSNQTEQALNVLSNRQDLIEQFGGNPGDTQEIAQLISSNDIQGAISLLDGVETAGVRGGFLDDLEARRRKEQQSPAKSDVEKNFTKITGLRQQLGAARKSGVSSAIEVAQQQLDDFQQLSGKFGATTQEKADIAVTKAANVELSKQAAKASKEAFDGLKGVRSSVGNMTDAIRALNKGASTGPIISRLPSFREASIELDNIRGKMGLDIVGATTFGALSESELAFALDVALPDKLDPEALKKWLTRKRDAQRKLGKELMRAATFLGKPGNTIASYIEREQNAGRLTFEAVQGEDDITKVSDSDLLSF